MDPSLRGPIVGALFVALVLTIVACTLRGRRLVRTERSDAVFGNPARALGGWHWVVTGLSSLLVVWLWFSWDAARAFFPDSANELCQVAKVDTALRPMHAAFPIDSRRLKGTDVVDRETRLLDRLQRRIERDDVDPAERAALSASIDRTRALLVGRADPGQVAPDTVAALDGVAARIDAVAAALASGTLPADAERTLAAHRADQPGWGVTSTEIPVQPVTARGLRFDAVAPELADASKDFSRTRNVDPAFETEVEATETGIAAASDAATTDAGRDVARQLDKLVARIDDGNVFPPGTLAPVEAALTRLDARVSDATGSLGLVDAVALPGGSIDAGKTACTEQGSGRWLPKPSDTLGTLARIADPDVGYKGFPLLWYRWKPMSEMVAFVVPDWIADLVPGPYPRHDDTGSIPSNLKSDVLAFATGDFGSPSVPVPMGHLWDSLLRVLTGLAFGILLGVPLGLFMGLSRFANGYFDPLIELYRPVPPLAWAPLILTIFGIQDDGKIFLLFMVAFAIMVISARTGATGTQLSKIHAAHSLGASRWQILKNVILPNSLPEILTGIRISIGVCWGTLVAAEMLAGTTGLGFVENVARKQSDYEIIWVTIILLGALGLLFDLCMRQVIRRTIPWRGKG